MVLAFLSAFIPIFVAVDAIGILPIFVGLTQGVKKDEKSKIISQSMVTALSLAIGFILLGKAVFKLLGITMSDFMVAGGAILFCIALRDIFSTNKQRQPLAEVGAVPIGTPLIVGPAVLTTSLMMVDQHGLWPTIIAVLLNVLLAGMVLRASDVILKILGKNGTAALSKIMALLLGAIAVMMIRKGVFLMAVK